LASTARAPDHAPQHLIALDKVVTQRGNDMDEHDRGKHIGENHVRLLDPLRTDRSTAVTSGGTSIPNKSLVMGTRNVVATIQPVSEAANSRT